MGRYKEKFGAIRSREDIRKSLGLLLTLRKTPKNTENQLKWGLKFFPNAPTDVSTGFGSYFDGLMIDRLVDM